MNVHIIRPHLEDEKSKTGLGGYADLITQYLNEDGCCTDIIETEFSLQNGVWQFLMRDVFTAFLSTLKMRKNDIAHYTFEGSALFIPFCRSKKIVTFHHYVYKTENNSKKWYILWKLSAMMAVKLSDRIIAASEQTKSEIIKEMAVNPDKIIVLHHLANNNLYVDPDIHKNRWIGTMGTLTERKNYPALLRVFSKIIEYEDMQDMELHIVGDGTLKDSIIEYSDKLGIRDRMHIHQNLNNDELNRFYNECILTLNTSLHEGIGLLTLESQKCGTPVMYFDFAKIPESTTVAAVSCTSEEDMVKQSCEILRNSGRYNKIREEGIEYSNKYFKDYRESILNLYRGL